MEQHNSLATTCQLANLMLMAWDTCNTGKQNAITNEQQMCKYTAGDIMAGSILNDCLALRSRELAGMLLKAEKFMYFYFFTRSMCM